MIQNKRNLRILSIVLLLSFHYFSKCQYQSPDIIQTLNPERLPVDDQNWEISQSPLTHFMYFANSNGLVEYNGLSSAIYHLPSHQTIRSVFADSDGKIYTGSFEDFGSWADDGKGSLIYKSLTGGITLPKNDEIWNILKYEQTIYFQSFTSIYALTKGKIRIIPAPWVMLFMFPVKNSFIVQALGKGLYHFNGEKFNFMKGSEILSSSEVLSVIERPADEIWICTADNGIYSSSKQAFRPLNNEVSESLKIYTCNAGIAINDTLLAFGTILNGVIFSNEKGRILNTYNNSNGLRNNTVLSLYKDSDLNLWAGLDEGINSIATTPAYKLFSDKNGKLGTIYSLYRKNNLIYFGTNHGLFVSGIYEKEGEYHFSNLSLIEGTQGQVWKIFEHEGRLFCGHNEGTFLVNDRTVTAVSDITGGWCFTGFHDALLQGTYTG